MLLSLNEHCLLRICDFLNVEDQIELSRVCEFLQDFFVNNVWQWKCKRICLENSFWDKKENEAFLPNFIRIAAASVEEFTLEGKHIEKYYASLIELQFPKMKKCSAKLDKHDQILKITRIFSNIKELHAIGEAVSRDILLLKELENLSLETKNRCINFDISEIYSLSNLKKINLIGWEIDFLDAIKNAQSCTTLEEISFDIFFFRRGIINDLKNIKNLRTINVWTDYSYFRTTDSIKRIEKHFGEAIDTLMFHGMTILCRNAGEMLKLSYLRCMIFYKTNLESNELEQLCRELPESVEEFYYLHCSYVEQKGEESAHTFFPLINKSNNLRLLDVSGSDIRKNFVADIAKEISTQDRQRPLMLRCYQTKIMEEHLQNLLLPGNLQVSLSKEKYFFDTSTPKHFQVKLDRTKIKEGEEKEHDVDELDVSCYDISWDYDDDHYYGSSDNEDYGKFNAYDYL